jgi:nitric oxide dioxygenase
MFVEAGVTAVRTTPRVITQNPGVFRLVLGRPVSELLNRGVITYERADRWWAAMDEAAAAGHFITGATAFIVSGTVKELASSLQEVRAVTVTGRCGLMAPPNRPRSLARIRTGWSLGTAWPDDQGFGAHGRKSRCRHRARTDQLSTEEQSMTDDQVTMVKESWDKVAPIASTAAELFYGRLFEVAPGVRALFPDDMANQKRKLMSTIGSIVSRIDDLDALDPHIHALAVRHARHGAAPAHYDVVGDCLLWTLDKGLGDDFTPRLRDAWTAAYALLSASMIAAAEAHGAAV